MSEPRFTSGSWRKIYTGEMLPAERNAIDEPTICTVGDYLIVKADCRGYDLHGEDVYDASLIEYAPDLYAALEGTGDHLMVAARILSSLGHADDGVAMLEARDRNIDLLSKARGELG